MEEGGRPVGRGGMAVAAAGQLAQPRLGPLGVIMQRCMPVPALVG
jgi:hypothetical protein